MKNICSPEWKKTRIEEIIQNVYVNDDDDETGQCPQNQYMFQKKWDCE